MVAYLEKTEGNAQFHKIVDFLSRSSIFYALTVSPNVSNSLIEQFWNSAVSQTVNNVSQIKATISGQTVLISELLNWKDDLLFNDDNGIDCLTIADIYENLPLMGSKSTSWDQFPTNVASAVICLATDRTFNFSKMIFDGMNRNLEAKKKYLMYPRVLALETSKDAQAAENLKLKTRIKKLEKKWEENAKPVPTLDDSAFDNLDADLAHGMEIKEVVNGGRQIKETKELNVTHDIEVLEKGGSNEEPVNATGNIGVSIVVPKDDKAKLKGVAIKEVEESDRHKGVLEEEPEPAKKLKKSNLDASQLAIDEEVARQVNAELQAELEGERVTAEEATQAVIARDFDEIQARMNADTLLAERLQEEEREQFTIEQRAKFLHDTIAA
ncbi:hypothetical protein Tco_0851445 [Tanacetum coccineum]